MTTAPNSSQRCFTYADYLTWPDEERWELIDGLPYDMRPSPTIAHQQAVMELGVQLANWLNGKPAAVFFVPVDVCLPDGNQSDDEITNVAEPDILVVCDLKKIEDRGIRGAPDFIIEVASPSTGPKDQITKAALYERFGVREYWVLSLTDRLLTVRVLGPDGRFTGPNFVEARGRVAVSALPGLELDLDPVFEQPGVGEAS